MWRIVVGDSGRQACAGIGRRRRVRAVCGDRPAHAQCSASGSAATRRRASRVPRPDRASLQTSEERPDVLLQVRRIHPVRRWSNLKRCQVAVEQLVHGRVRPRVALLVDLAGEPTDGLRRKRAVQTWWARQGSNLRPLGCKTSRQHLPWPQPATTVTGPASPGLRNHPGRLHFVSHGVSRVQTIMHGCGHGRTRRDSDADLALASGTAASNTAATASDHVLGWPAQSPRLDARGPVSPAGGPPPSR
jgi:hypothetical protein